MPLTRVAVTMIGEGSNQSFAPGVPIYENNQTIISNYTLRANTNAMSAGPITIADNVTITIEDNAYWTIV